MSYDDEDSGQLGIPAGGQGAERPAKSDSPWSHAAWSHALSRRGGTAHSPRVGKPLSWGSKLKLPVPSNLPKGASLSPAGDLGELRQVEAMKVLPIPVHKDMNPHIESASRRIRLKEKFVQ